MESSDIIQYLIIVISAVGGAYITVRVAIAELKKDIGHLKEKLDAEVEAKNELKTTHQAVINEVRDDVKAIFRTLTKMQVDQAKSEGQESLIKAFKEALTDLKK